MQHDGHVVEAMARRLLLLPGSTIAQTGEEDVLKAKPNKLVEGLRKHWDHLEEKRNKERRVTVKDVDHPQFHDQVFLNNYLVQTMERFYFLFQCCELKMDLLSFYRTCIENVSEMTGIGEYLDKQMYILNEKLLKCSSVLNLMQKKLSALQKSNYTLQIKQNELDMFCKRDLEYFFSNNIIYNKKQFFKYIYSSNVKSYWKKLNFMLAFDNNNKSDKTIHKSIECIQTLRQYMLRSVHIFFHDINPPENINVSLEERNNAIDLLMQMSNTKKSNVNKTIKEEITEESLEQVCLFLCLKKTCILNSLYRRGIIYQISQLQN